MKRNKSSPPNSGPNPQRLMQMAWAYSMPLVIEAGIKHRVFDLLDEGPKSLEQLSKASATSVRGLSALLNMLVSFDLLAKQKKANRYALTPESSAFLVSGKPTFRGGLFKHVSTQLIPKWTQLTEIVKTGKPALAVNQEKQGAKFFQGFVEDIFTMSYDAAGVLGDALKIAGAKSLVRVLDIAAGSGVWGIALAEKSPRVSVTAVDWKEVLPVTRRIAARHRVGDRFKYIAGDLREVDFGTDHNIATLGHILHSEGPTRSRALIKKVFRALAPGGTIAIAEFVTNDDRTGPPSSMIFAVNMLVNTADGDAFTGSEIAGWLTDAGFKNIRTLQAPAPSPLILARKPDAPSERPKR